MTLAAGSVVVDDGGGSAGTGLAAARYDAKKALFDAAMVGCPLPFAQVVVMLKGLAAECNASAAADTAYLVANAVAHLTVSGGNLQTTTNIGDPTGAPAGPQNLTGTLT